MVECSFTNYVVVGSSPVLVKIIFDSNFKNKKLSFAFFHVFVDQL